MKDCVCLSGQFYMYLTPLALFRLGVVLAVVSGCALREDGLHRRQVIHFLCKQTVGKKFGNSGFISGGARGCFCLPP